MGELVSSNNIIHILENFKINTEAQATNQGFYYQYLVTLDVWLKNYNSQNNVAIYCETEDDIKLEDLESNRIEFTQVKAYATNFTIKSDEVQKSIVNFFQLYTEYKDKSPSFVFYTNTDYEGDFFNKIKNDSYKNEIISKIEEVLVEKFEEKNNKKLTKLNKDITESNTYILNTPNPKSTQKDKYNRLEVQLKDSTREKKQLEDDFNELKIFINEETPNFIAKIKWEAEKEDKDTSINKFTKSIEREIAKIDGFKLDTSSAYAHLINKVLYASQALNIEDRRLDNNMIDSLIEEAKSTDMFKQGLQSAELLMTFSKFCEYHKIQIQALTSIEFLLKQTNTKLDSQNSDIKRILSVVEKDNNLNVIPANFKSISNEIFLLNGMEKKEKELIQDRLKYIVESSFKYLIPIEIKQHFSEELLIDGQSIDELNNKELWSMYLEFIVISILLDECSPINILAIEKIYKKRKFVFAKADDWIELKKNILYSDLTRLEKGGTVIVCCDGDRKPTRCTIKNSTLHDISRGMMPERMKIDSGIESPYKDFKFKHIHIVQKQMIEDNENSDIFDDLDVESTEKVIKDEIRKVLN